MTNLNEHYSALLGLPPSWRVDEVVLELEKSQVLIRLSHQGGELACSCCAEPCSQADVAPERTWRHLDTMQFKTEIKAAVPRSRCTECGVKTISGKNKGTLYLFVRLVLNDGRNKPLIILGLK